MLNNLKNYDIILASGSPRRKELLAGLGLKFNVKVLNGIDESYPPTIPATEVAQFISKKKSAAYAQLITPENLIITADTVVVCDNNVLGKPKNKKEAKSMLNALSGKTHQVITGVTILSVNKSVSFSVNTDVRFAKLSESEISYYIEKYHPFDKAGAYGIQEWIGFIGVEFISGSYYNVMGLPVQRLYTELKKW